MHKCASPFVRLFHVLKRVLSLWTEVWASVTKLADALGPTDQEGALVSQ